MTLEYPITNTDNGISSITDEYREWFYQVVGCLLYPDTCDFDFPSPAGISKLINKDVRADNPQTIDALRNIHGDIIKAAAALMAATEKGEKPPFNAFDGFLDLFNELFLQLRRLERESLQVDLGVDPVTKLRSRKAMEQDLSREMERRARRGKPFSLVLAHIDDYPQWSAPLSTATRQQVICHIAGLINKCVRSFDDAYRIGDGEFVMALKQSDTSGGIAAIERLRMLLAQSPVAIDGVPPITMSFCTAEPTPGDDIEKLITYMRNDLSHHDDDKKSASVEYLEQSPLERFIKNQEV